MSTKLHRNERHIKKFFFKKGNLKTEGKFNFIALWQVGTTVYFSYNSGHYMLYPTLFLNSPDIIITIIL